MSLRNHRIDKKLENFLTLLAETGMVRDSAVAAKICLQTLYKTKRENHAFATAWMSALDEFADSLEDVMVNRIKANSADKASHLLLMFYLKGLRPHKYRDAPPQSTINISMKEIAQKLDQAEAESDSDTDY